MEQYSADRGNPEFISQLNHRIYDKLSRVMTGENILAELHAQLIHGIIDYTGSQRTAFIKKEASIYVIQAEEWSNESKNGASTQHWDVHLPNWPEKVISKMDATHPVLNLNQDSIIELFGTHSKEVLILYPKSILCLPVTHKGQTLGFIYLENHLTENAFDTEHLKMLHIIATQYALSLVLFEEAQKLIWQKSKELNQTRQLLCSAKLKLEKLEQLSAFDGLTGLHNRGSFDRYLLKEWRRAIREATPLSMILVDIDMFSRFNENYGFLVGDDCITQIAAIIDKTIKRPGDMVSKYNGDRYGLVLPNTDAKGAFFIAEQIREKVAELAIEHKYSDIADHVTISSGVATANPAPKDSLHEFTGEVEEALYLAKIAGRNRTCFNSKD
jgi:diguanylate cyclase (GGDEF)-like protein